MGGEGGWESAVADNSALSVRAGAGKMSLMRLFSGTGGRAKQRGRLSKVGRPPTHACSRPRLQIAQTHARMPRTKVGSPNDSPPGRRQLPPMTVRVFCRQTCKVVALPVFAFLPVPPVNSTN